MSGKIDRRRGPRSPEVRAKIREGLKARPDWLDNALRALEAARKSPKFHTPRKPRTRPEPGTEERRYFDKLASIYGSAAAHAELRRGAQ